MTFLNDLAAAAVAQDLPQADRQQIAWIIGEYEVVDGVEFDLARTLRDSRGCLWWWTGDRDQHGRAMMESSLGEMQPLVSVYLAHVPLVPQPRRLGSGDYRQALAGGAA
ncbi:phiSA1p31-related protein [Streptomyces sp. URMC 124]|uniref:phiSA1p31-related protein n=1 Tax=Streptomyces sp. URMC 124 TaxID=3423405 RepID=UPI003F1D58FA